MEPVNSGTGERNPMEAPLPNMLSRRFIFTAKVNLVFAALTPLS
jgi:hypothetical protein